MDYLIAAPNKLLITKEKDCMQGPLNAELNLKPKNVSIVMIIASLHTLQ